MENFNNISQISLIACDARANPKEREYLSKTKKEAGVYPEVERVFVSPHLECVEMAHYIYERQFAITHTKLLPYTIENEIGVTRYRTRVLAGFRDIIKEMENASIKTSAVVAHSSVIALIIRKYVIPHSVYKEIDLKHGDGNLLEYNHSTGYGKIIRHF